MFMRAPADQRAEIRQDTVVQKRNIETLQRRAQDQNEARDQEKLGAILLQHTRRLTRGQEIDHPTHIIDQRDLNDGDKQRHRCRECKEPFERLRIFPQERP